MSRTICFVHAAAQAERKLTDAGRGFGGGSTTHPPDVLPRILSAEEWHQVETGAAQRIRALNLLLHDLYHDAEIIRAGLLPAQLVYTNPLFQIDMCRLNVPGGNYVHCAALDLARVAEDEFRVLEDRLDVPAGGACMVETRGIMAQQIPDLYSGRAVSPVCRFPDRLLETLKSFARERDPTVVLLASGLFDGTHFELAWLAGTMGVELVEPSDLFVSDGRVYMSKTTGSQCVDVIYRGISDYLLDPLARNPDPFGGVPGLLSVYRTGGVIVANAVGTAIAGSRSIYPLVPDIIRFYLGEKPILGNVRSFELRKAEDRAYVLEHLDDLVVKDIHHSGDDGVVTMEECTRAEREACRARILADPARFVAQPVLPVSACTSFSGSEFVQARLGLRVFVLSGTDIHVAPGALSRPVSGGGTCLSTKCIWRKIHGSWITRDLFPACCRRRRQARGGQTAKRKGVSRDC